MEHFLREIATGSILPHLNMAARNINIAKANNNNNAYHNETEKVDVETLNENLGSSYNNSLIINSGESGKSIEILTETNNEGRSVSDNLYFIQSPKQMTMDVLSSNNIISGGDGDQYEDFTEYLFNETSSPASRLLLSANSSAYPSSSQPALHLLASLSSVTTTTISSITHKHQQTENETLFDLFSCDGESQTLSALNFSLAAGNDSISLDGDHHSDEALSSIYFKTAVYLLYIPIFVFALLGNGTVCYIVQSTPRMRTVTNYFIANLAVGDILMSLFCVPSSFISIFILGYWPFGIVLCHLVNYSQAVSVLVSAYTLVAISIDRYIAIMWPLRPRITKRYAKFIIGSIWAIALATAFPIPIVSKLVQPGEWHVYCERYVCQEEWTSKEQNYYYTWALLTLQFLVPLSVLIFTYTRIALAVWGKRPPGEAENSRDQRMARSKRKVRIVML